MDPDEALKLIRKLAAKIADSEVSAKSKDHLIKEFIDDSITLALAIDGLDVWMSRGSFLPKEWSKYRAN